ncbi:MAG: hypothetical protein EXR98_08475 [Gemmataceae bacterium]|nr:hypothetical protein [Gemmataceae bacterium]
MLVANHDLNPARENLRMSISLACQCGNVIIARVDQAGERIACFECGYLILVPASGDTPPVLGMSAADEIPDVLEVAEPEDVVHIQALATPPEVIPADAFTLSEDIPVVIPVADDEIPEVDVEEHQAPWEKNEARADSRDKQAAAAEVNKPPSEFARNAAAGSSSWATIGEIRLVEPAECIAYGPGGVLALAGQDDEVLVLNMKTGKKLDRFGGHDEIVTAVAVSTTGDRALSGDRLGDVCYWDIGRCRRMRRMREHESPISALAFSPDGNFAAAGDREGSVRLWKLTSRKDRTLADSDWGAKITSIAFSADGNLLLAGSERGHVAVWSAQTGACVQRFRLPQQAIAGVQFSSRHGVLFAAARPAEVKHAAHPSVWRLEATSKQTQECFPPTDQADLIPMAVLLDQGANRLLVAGTLAADQGRGLACLQVWNLAGARLLYAFHDVKHAVDWLAITPGGTRVIAALTNNLLQAFALPQHDEAPPFDAPTQEPQERRRRVE